MRSIRVVKSVPCYTYVRFIERDSGVPPNGRECGSKKKNEARWRIAERRRLAGHSSLSTLLPALWRVTRENEINDPGGSDARRRAACVSDRAVALSFVAAKTKKEKRKKHDGARKRIDRLVSDWYHRRTRFHHAAPKWVRLPSRHPSGVADWFYLPAFFRLLVIRVVNAARAHSQAISALMADGRCWWRI